MSTRDVDSDRYPRLAQYIRRLPEGLRSYPDCKAKAVLVVSCFEDHDVSGLGEGLPEVLVKLLRSPPSPGLWVQGTLSDAMFYTIADAFYPTEQGVMEWTRRRTMKTASSKLYRAIRRLTRPRTLVRMATSFHGLVQRGTDLAGETADNGAVMRLTHPPYLHGGLNHRSNVPMFATLIEGARGLNVEVAMSESTPTHATYEAHWEPRAPANERVLDRAG